VGNANHVLGWHPFWDGFVVSFVDAAKTVDFFGRYE
jgi:hypothetical protein